MKTGTAVGRSGAESRAERGVDTQVYTAGLATLALVAGAIGVWAATALVGGMLAGGGPVGLVAGWFRAVFGI